LIARRHALGLIGAALLLPGCSAKAVNVIRIGSTGSPENATIAEIYALALERGNIAVDRHMNLGNAQMVMAATQRGEIDIYPEYVRTGATNLRETSLRANAVELYNEAKPFYEQRYGITWLTPSPLNDSPCLATSQYAAEEFWLLTLTKCAAIASQLRFAATPDFLAPGGVLQRLQEYYGGFRFKKVFGCDPGTQYDMLSRGDAEVANAFTTDANIAEDQLIVLGDDKHFWPLYNVAPVIRLATVQSHPHVRFILNHISRTLTNYAIQQLNMRRDLLNMDPHDVAKDFVTAGTR